MNIAILGGGLAGCSIAYFINRNWKKKHSITIFEKEDYLGGLCHTKYKGGIPYEHGPHILYSKNPKMISFFEHLLKIIPINVVVGTCVEDQILDYPVSIKNILKLKDSVEIIDELYHCEPSKLDSTNFETYMISLMGKTLYKKFIYGYTKKMWGREPKELSAAWAPNRISFRKDDIRLFGNAWQGYPQRGYNILFEKLTKNCNVKLNTNLNHKRIDRIKKEFDFVFNTLPIDEIYNFSEGILEYRGLKLELELINREKFWENNLAWVNFPNHKEYCRICEYKNINQYKDSSKTLISREYPSDNLWHYPVYTKNNQDIFNKYLKIISKESNIITSGRLGLFLYLPMDKTVQISEKTVNFFEKYSNMDESERFEYYLEMLKIYNKF